MNRLPLKRAWPVIVLAVLSAGTILSPAGDAIIFPRDKPKSDASKAEPGKEVPGSRENLKVWDNLPSVDPRSLDSLLRPSPRHSRNKTKEEKRLQMEQDQKRNWLLLRPDQLREEQEQQENIPFPDRDDETDQGNGRHDYTFHGLNEPKDGIQGTQQDQRANPQARRANLSRRSTEDLTTGEGRKASPPGKLGQDAGAHTARELDLRGLFDSSPGSPTAEMGKSDPIWRDVMGSGGSTRTWDQQRERLDKLGSSLGPDTKPVAEWGRPPSTPSFPKSLDNPSRSGVDSPFGGLSAARSPIAPTLPDWAPQRSPMSSQNASAAPRYNPWDQQPVNRPSVIRPTVLEIPQRKL